jgi:hypothetical protein
MPQCQFLFSAVFVFQKSYIENIPDTKMESKAETEEGQGLATP